MSGSYRASASSILSNAMQSRADIRANIDNRINRDLEINILCEDKLELIKEKTRTVEIIVSEEIKSPEQKAELLELLNKIKKAKEEILKFQLTSMKYEINEKNNIDADLKNADERANQLRKELVGWNSYGDSYQYNRANQLVNDYYNCNMRLNKIVGTISSKARENNEKISKVEIGYKNLEKLKESFEIKTRSILNSNNLEYIKNIYGTIDFKIAEKFLSSEYRVIKSEVSGLNNNNIESKFSSLKIKIEKFVENLREIYDTYLFKKDRTEKSLQNLETIVENFKLNRMEAYISREENLVGMYEFAELYSVKDVSREQYEENIQKINNFLKKEEFDEAYLLIEKTQNTVDGEIEILNKEYSRITGQIEYAAVVQEIAQELGYDVVTKRSTGKFEDGYNITLTMGDEVVDMKPRISDDGEVSFNVYHKESVTGSCSETMENLGDALKREGILIKDLLDHRDKNKKTSTNKNQVSTGEKGKNRKQFI